jgi:hypothetical protein
VRTTFSLLHTYHLLVCATYAVTNGEDESMQYALCGMAPLSFTQVNELMLTVREFHPSRLREFCDAAALCGFTPCELSFGTAPADTLFVTLTGSGELTVYLIWLTLFASAYRVDGFLYHTTKEN